MAREGIVNFGFAEAMGEIVRVPNMPFDYPRKQGFRKEVRKSMILAEKIMLIQFFDFYSYYICLQYRNIILTM